MENNINDLIIESSNFYRNNLYPGLKVDIVLKKDQRTGKLTRGIIKRILTNKSFHSRGIKVQLTTGQVGRVQHILNNNE